MSPPAAKGDWKDLFTGGVLQCLEAGTLGLPFEVMKTRQASFPQENIFQSFSALKSKGISAFWKGFDAKMTESFLKGGVFLYSKDYLEAATVAIGFEKGTFVNGTISGAGAGVCQTLIMSPMTYVVTYKVNHHEHKSTLAILKESGIRGAYSGSSAVAARQASNWALRQGLVNWVNNRYKEYKGGQLSPVERVFCGLVGGALAAVNHPLEVLRIRMQRERALASSSGQSLTGLTLVSTARKTFAEHGFMGFWAGVIPRVCLSAYQSLFMITFAAMVKEQLKKALGNGNGNKK